MSAPQEPRAEPLAATDEQIDDAVSHADPMALRGLPYRLTGDDEVVATKVGAVPGYVGGNLSTGLTDPADVALLRAKAARFLASYRDDGPRQPVGIGPLDRLPRSLALAGGVTRLPDDDVGLWIEELALEPWARGLTWDKTEDQTHDFERSEGFSVLVIGAGRGGLNAAAQLKHAGIDVTVLEKNPGVGGTWYENRYPGARVDSPSRAYTHILGVDFDCRSPWCSRDESQRYFTWVADRYGLRPHIVFDTEVTTMTWHDDTARWVVAVHGPDGEKSYLANAVVSAVGLLSRPSLPQIDGMNDFAGPAFHTARWPEGIDLAGRRVAVIGTGCSGVQLVPELARLAAHVTVFQRTPQWLFGHDGCLSPFPPQVTWLDRNLPDHANFMRFRTNWLLGPYLSGPTREIDPDYRDDPHAASAVRPVQVDSGYNFYDAILRDDVTLVTEGIERITGTGVTTTDGRARDVDVIVYATGFKADECLWPMEVRGRGGRPLSDLWAKDGPRAYLGTMLPGFQNLFLIYGPNMNPDGGLGVVNHEEMVTRYLLDCLRQVLTSGRPAIEVTEQAYWRYNEQLDRRETYKIYQDPRARSYCKNAHGRSVTNCPFPGNEMWHRLRRPNPDDLIIG
jgi:4-hydroxyacetophenone monooxygenase